MHKVLPTQTTDGLKFVVKYDSAKKMWKPAAEEVKQMAIWVTCDKHETPTPEMPMYPMADNISGLGDQIVAVLCNNVPTGQQSGKYYGLIGGGFTSTTPTLNADKVYESTIKLFHGKPSERAKKGDQVLLIRTIQLTADLTVTCPVTFLMLPDIQFITKPFALRTAWEDDRSSAVLCFRSCSKAESVLSLLYSHE